MYHGKLLINTVLVLVISVLMTLFGSEWWGIAASAAVLVISAAFNSRDVIVACKQILSSTKGRKQQIK